ncbi:MAG: patatin family protein [Candidatus Gastranaerophilales bacterium]|nr:patatin family protein [Candidatus Gastranaerophilales bacterium]
MENKKEFKTTLILEGGAMRGLYSAGVLDVFMENNIKADTIYGVSAGALFGLNYKSRQIGRALRYNLKYVSEKNYMGLYSLITTGNIMNREFCFNKLVYELDKLDFETYKNNPVDFYAVVTNLQTGKPEYIKIDDADKDIEYFRASGSMPFVSKPVEIDGKFYLDGAISDAVPFKKVLETDCEKIIVILTRPLGYRKKKVPLPYGLFYGKFPNMVETAKNYYKEYNATMDLIDKYESENKIVVLRPSELVKMKRVEKDKRKLQRIYDLGVSDSKNNLDKIKEYLNC